jgi:acyl-CoA synthetase (AMP-forming)/AMP-acid ligase II
LAEGYLGASDLTRERFAEEFRTRDLGFLLDGELFVTGRIDDVMSIAGRNVYATDIEAAIELLPDVGPGKCAVVALDETEETRLVALIELTAARHDLTAIGDTIRAKALLAAGIAINECLFLARGQLPKTPSGKLQRFRCREIAAERSIGGSVLGRR